MIGRSFGIFFTILLLTEISLAIPRRRFYPAARDESSGAGEVPSKPPDESIEGRRRIPPFGDPDLLGNGVFDMYDTDLGHIPKDRDHGIIDNNPDYDFREPSDVDYAGPGKGFGYGRPTLDKVPVVPPGKEDTGRDDGAEKKDKEFDEENKVDTNDAEEKDETDNEDEHKEGDQGTEEDTEDKKNDDSGAQDSSEDEVKTSETHAGDDEKNEGHDETDLGDDENAGEGVKDEDEVETGIEDKEENGGVLPFDEVFDSPFFNFKQVNHYFQQLEKALENSFRAAVEDAAHLNTTYSNTTEEEIEMDGKKYKVHTSVLKAGNDNESFYMDVKYTEPVLNDTNVSDQH
ncbi:nardilysin-like [Stegodyphus dumicola]|uniref:nardilysin-like n=1 Tax=Stegodyphus dumicola TaxID=202533 RepID=UPI0015AC7411|nr:nardilysin-like [Stegodyphus dumicola]